MVLPQRPTQHCPTASLCSPCSPDADWLAQLDRLPQLCNLLLVRALTLEEAAAGQEYRACGEWLSGARVEVCELCLGVDTLEPRASCMVHLLCLCCNQHTCTVFLAAEYCCYLGHDGWCWAGCLRSTCAAVCHTPKAQMGNLISQTAMSARNVCEHLPIVSQHLICSIAGHLVEPACPGSSSSSS